MAKAEKAATMVVKVDGKEYVLRFDEVNAHDASQLRRETGFSVQGLFTAAQSDADIDVIAAAVWLARRQGGERNLTFEAVARDISYQSELDSSSTAEPADPEGDSAGS